MPIVYLVSIRGSASATIANPISGFKYMINDKKIIPNSFIKVI